MPEGIAQIKIAVFCFDIVCFLEGALSVGGTVEAAVGNKKIGGAVQRNRAKRLLREGYRAVKARGLKTGYLVVLVAREDIRGKRTQDVERELCRAFQKLNLFADET